MRRRLVDFGLDRLHDGLRRHRRSPRLLGFLLPILLCTSPAWAGDPLRPVPTVMHIHSTWSTGESSLEALIARARAVGVEAIFLTENSFLQFEYGLFPLRGLLRYRVEYPSLLNRGPEAFLDAVRAGNARQKDVLLIPGAEVSPYYYWTGSLFKGSLTMHDGEKKLLAFGLYGSEDYRALPAVGNPDATRWGWGSLWLLSPGLLGIPGVWLIRLRKRRVVRLQHFRVALERRYTGYGILCLAIGAVWLANNFPFRTAPVSAYDPNGGVRPYQAVIDFVLARGGLIAWSLPEARDYQVIHVGGFRATVVTEPYPSALLETDRFTAFGGVYEDTTTFTDPGRGWDHLLTEYLGGRRTAPAWAIGEAAYHHEGQAGKRLGTIQTVLLVDRKAPSSLLQAVRAGRMYALQRTAEAGLILDQFQVMRPDQPPAEAGDQVSLRPGLQPEVQAAVRAT
ncbi:MAG TPA: hypothetical protein VEU07_12095, partial [Candidatus Acidoferrum sp.]|nr:hypothetical protein [Candidatus Acidoferrum sp.]